MNQPKQSKRHYMEIAAEQLALDWGGSREDFFTDGVKILLNPLLPGRRIYSDSVWDFGAIFTAGGVVLSTTRPALAQALTALAGADPRWLTQGGGQKKLTAILAEEGLELSSLRPYYTPDPALTRDKSPLPEKCRLLEDEALEAFREDGRYHNALAFQPEMPDRMALALYEGEEIIAMAGISEDSPSLWQMGIDVLPAHRGRGLGALLTRLLAREALAREKLPFYGTAFSHLASQQVAVSAGFFPAWTELIGTPLVK